MAKPDQKAKCGEITITYPGDCSYVCYCTPESGCHWAVTCGTWTTGGKGLISNRRPKHRRATLSGKLEGVAKILEQRWKRRVIVPAALRRKTIRKRTIKGTPEEMAAALGLELGKKLKR